jgi:4-hydroxybenzoate polyprenyltransferase
MEMPIWLQKLLRIGVFGNIWIAIGALSMYLATVELHHLPFSFAIASSIFGATLLFYNYHRLFRKDAIYQLVASERHNWILENHSLLLFLALGGAAMAMAGIWPFLTSQLIIRLSPFLALAILYVIPIWRKEGRWMRLRDLPFIKIFLVAAVWAFVTVALPFIATQANWLPNRAEAFTLLQRFVFIFAITLPFDIRDLEHDRANGVKTIAASLGIDAIKNLSRALLALVALIGFGAYSLGDYQMGHALALLVSCATTGSLISKADAQSDEWFFAGWLDGSMLDQLFWIWLLGSLF